MRAPRAFACSYSSSTSDAGAFAQHEAVAVLVPRAGWRVAGSSLRVDSARAAAEAADAERRDRRLGAAGDHHVGVAVLDQPRRPSPMQCVAVVQAVTIARFGPLAAELDRDMAGDHVDDRCRARRTARSRAGRASRQLGRASSSISGRPPMPEPMLTPMRSAFSGVDLAAPQSRERLQRRPPCRSG